jgi:hypothetical protein
MELNTANRTISNFQGTLGASYTITSQAGQQAPIQITGPAVTTSGLNIRATGPATLNGSLNAALYGPQAQNIGGNFNANDGEGPTSKAINGVFLGSR